MKEYVKCIDAGANTYIYTDGIYEVVQRTKSQIVVITPNGGWQRYNPERFIEHKGENMTTQTEAQKMVKNRSWIVGSFSDTGVFSISTSPKEHLSEDKAKAEAKRLAAEDSTRTFIVLQFRAGYKMTSIQEI